MNWQSPETAPKNQQLILNVGLPWAVAGCWNDATESWVFAEYQVGMYDGTYSDSYYQNEYEKTILGWIPLPEIVLEVKNRRVCDIKIEGELTEEFK
jgi:hypothetical protein